MGSYLLTCHCQGTFLVTKTLSKPVYILLLQTPDGTKYQENFGIVTLESRKLQKINDGNSRITLCILQFLLKDSTA